LLAAADQLTIVAELTGEFATDAVIVDLDVPREAKAAFEDELGLIFFMMLSYLVHRSLGSGKRRSLPFKLT
jgi:hypothetical protein